MTSQTHSSSTRKPVTVINANHQLHTTKWFDTTHVVAIGINEYKSPIARLSNAVNDAEKIYNLFDEKCLHSREIIKKHKLLDEQATLDKIREKLESLKTEVKENDRLIFYYAGHGIALHIQESTESEPKPNLDKGESKPKPKNRPRGYLIPYNADMNSRKNYLSMDDLLDWLNDIECRHGLIILDCCYAGSIQWSLDRTTREMLLQKIYPTVLDNYINKNAWFILTSSDENEKANDGEPIELNPEEQLKNNTRGSGTTSNSPFVRCLEEALIKGEADVYPKDKKDHIITTVELEAYLSKVTNQTSEINGEESRQTPQRFKLTGKHGGGEFVFLLSDFENVRKELEADPDVTADDKDNPYRGLESYTENDGDVFFGREKLTEDLLKHVQTHPLTVVLGPSGAGKSSLVKAGLVPRLKKTSKKIKPSQPPIKWVSEIFRPGQLPTTALEEALKKLEITNIPDNTKYLLVIDQFEEVETQCRDQEERNKFCNKLIEQLKNYSNKLHLVFTLRSDFEFRLRRKLEDAINKLDFKNSTDWVSAKFIVTNMEREELQDAIEKPAKEKAVFFTSDQDEKTQNSRTLVQQLVHEVAGMPGALPLLSFALYTMYRHFAQRYVKSNKTIKREITWDDYRSLDGGVPKSLANRATEEYKILAIKENSTYAKDISYVMLRMIAIQGGDLVRRRVPLSELEYPSEKNSFVKAVINRFTDARLLVQGDDLNGKPYVELAHDALVGVWQKLLKWEQKEQEILVLQTELTSAATKWNGKKNEDKEQSKRILDTAAPIFDWLDRKLLSVEDLVTKRIFIQLLQLLQRPLKQLKLSRQTAVRYLWNASIYLEVSDKELKSGDNCWFNQVETEFVQQSVLKKRQNSSLRWRIANTVMLVLSGLTIWALIGQRNALIGQISAFRQASEANLLANKGIDSLISSLQAIKSLKQLDQKFFFWQDTELRTEVTATLRSVIYRSREINQWKGVEEYQGVVTYERSTKIAFNSQGQLILAQREKNGGITLRNLSQNTSVMLGEDKDSFIDCGIAFSKDARLVATAYEKGNIIVWDLNGKKITEFLTQFPKEKSKDGYNRFCPNLVFSPDGKQLAIGESYIAQANNIPEIENINLWDLSEDKPIKKQPFKKFEYKGYGFNSNNQLVVAEKSLDQENNSWYLFDFLSGNEITEIKTDSGIEFGATNLIFSPDNTKLIICNQLLNISKGDSDTDNLPQLSSSLENRIDAINFSPDGQQIVTKEEDGTINIKRIDNFHSGVDNPKVLKGHKGNISKIVFSSNGEQLASVGIDGVLRLWDLSEKLLVPVQSPLSKPVQMNIAQNSKKKNLEATWQSDNGDEGASNGSYYVRDEFGNLLFTTEDQRIDDTKKFNFNPDRTLFVVVDFNKVWLWDSSGRLLFESEIDKANFLEQGEKIEYKEPKFSDDGSLLVIEKCSDAEKCTPFKYFKLETSDELIVRGCNLVRDYLQNNPNVNVSKSDRHLCD